MSFLGIGAWEFILVLMLIVVVLGPERAREAGLALGRLIRRATSSEFWRELLQIARFMQKLPQNLVKMAELEEVQAQLVAEVATMQREIQQVTQPVAALASGQTLQDPLRELQAEVKQAVAGAQADVKQAAAGEPAAAQAPAVAGITPAVAAEESVEPLTGSNAPTAGVEPEVETTASAPPVEPAETLAPTPNRDEELIRMIQNVARYVEEWPAALERLAEIERTQARLAEQIRQLQTIAEVLSPVQSEEVQ